MRSRNIELYRCNKSVRQLCNKAFASCCQQSHGTCRTKKKAVLCSGHDINLFLASILSRKYGTESREGITIEANALADDTDYRVCPNFKQRIVAGL